MNIRTCLIIVALATLIQTPAIGDDQDAISDAAMIQRGWTDEELRKLAGGNLLRAMRRTESVAHELQ